MIATGQSEAILRHNSRWIPGGMSSLNRCVSPVISFVRAQGSRLWDVDGNEYIDFHAGFAPYILGHNDPDVNEAVAKAMSDGLSNFGSGPTLLEGQLAELFLDCVTTAEMVQFFNSGSEATAHAIRVARAATGREHVLVVQGSYNGHHNVVATNLMSSRRELGDRRISGDEYPLAPITAGIPGAELSLMHAVEFNDLAAVETVAQRHRLACLITEPVLQNIGVVTPAAGYLHGLRSLADKYGFLLVFDEVKTGFRSALGGYQSIAGVVPDLSTFGKAIANGMPIAAVAGKREYMALATSAQVGNRVLVAGTYNAHPLPVAAAIACISKLKDPRNGVYSKLESLGDRLAVGQQELFGKFGIKAVISRVGSAYCAYFMHRPPKCWWEILTEHDFAFDAKFRQALIGQGIYFFPLPVKQGSISFAHCALDIEQTLQAMELAIRSCVRSSNGPEST